MKQRVFLSALTDTSSKVYQFLITSLYLHYQVLVDQLNTYKRKHHAWLLGHLTPDWSHLDHSPWNCDRHRHCHRGIGSSSKRSTGFISGPVVLVSVCDGDTIRVKDAKGNRVTIRMACIDAPETSQGNSGRWSTTILKSLGPGEANQTQTTDHRPQAVAGGLLRRSIAGLP